MKQKRKPLTSYELWPRALGDRVYSGFTDSELELVCDWGLRGFDSTLPYQHPRWMYWTVELYSFGRCYRHWLSLPSWVPLPLYGDHGVAMSGDFEEHENRAKPKVHLTWCTRRAESLSKAQTTKKVLRIPHPWITFRRAKGIVKKPSAKGTLIFYTHSNVDTKVINDWDGYFEAIKALPDVYHPFVICMHTHDVNKGNHKNLRKYNIPIVSAGETSSPYFVERFYDLISNFTYATSPNGGSELYYCEELGVRYFIFGESPKTVADGRDEKELSKKVARSACWFELNDQKIELFRRLPLSSREHKNSKRRQQFVSQMLSLDMINDSAKAKLKIILAKEYTRHIPELIIWVIQSIADRIRRFIKQYANKFSVNN